MARRQSGKYPEQIVIMSRKPLADAVRAEAEREDESVAEIGRRWLTIGQRVQTVSEASGYSVESILEQVERTYAGTGQA